MYKNYVLISAKIETIFTVVFSSFTVCMSTLINISTSTYLPRV